MTKLEKFETFVFLSLVAAVMALGAYTRSAKGASGDPGFPTGGTIYGVGYNRDRQIVRFRSGLTVADSNSVSTALAAALAASPSQVFVLNGRCTLSVGARFAASSSNTCAVQVVWLYSTDGASFYVLGASNRLTCSANALQDAANPSTGTGAGYFMAPDLFFDGHGATHALILLTTAPTGGGAVDLWCGSQ